MPPEVRVVGKTATRPSTVRSPSSLPQKGGSSPAATRPAAAKAGVVNPTKQVAVKGKGLYVPRVEQAITEFRIPGIDDLNVPSDSPFDYVWGIHASKGWGKSSFAGLFGLEGDEIYTSDQRPTFVLMMETLRKGLDIRMETIPQASFMDLRSGTYRHKFTPWEMIKGYLMNAIQDPTVRMVSIDSFDLFCQHAWNHWMKDETVDTPTGKADHGRLWNVIKTDVRDTICQVKAAGKGLILTSHDKMVAADDPIRGEYYTMQPALSEWPYAIWREVTDFVLYGTFSETGRTLFCRGNQYLHASCGNRKRFLYPDAEGTIYPIASFHAGNSVEEAYGNFLKAFNNEQEPEIWFSGLSALAAEAAKKKKKKAVD